MHYTSSHVDLPSKVKVHQPKLSLKDPAGLAAWVGMGMVHYISTATAHKHLLIVPHYF
jgi:hypothetical protein